MRIDDPFGKLRWSLLFDMQDGGAPGVRAPFTGPGATTPLTGAIDVREPRSAGRQAVNRRT